MKKTFSFLFLLLLVVPLSAQVSREEDKYFIDGQKVSTKDFAAYMQDKAEANLTAQFVRGRKEMLAGWPLFGVGATVDIVGTGLMLYGQSSSSSVGESFKGMDGVIAMIAGSGVMVAGIVCLSVGYSDMRKAADGFIESQKKPIELTLTPASSGVGLALHF